MNVVHTACYSDKHSRDQATKLKPSRSVADVSVNRKRRLARLEQAVPAMRALFDCSIEPRIDPRDVLACAEAYTLARVELAHLRGELGVLDEDRITAIVEMFGVDHQRVDFTWHAAASVAQDGHEKRHRAASKRLADQGHAAVAHVPLVDLALAARLFHKTKSRDNALFAERPDRKRIHTGLPTLEIVGVTYTVVRGVPDGPGGGRFTTAERKLLAQELEVKIDTIRRAERDRTPEDFDVWANRLRKSAATKAKKEAARIARGKRRKRAPGKLAAVKRFIAYEEMMTGRRFSERHAFRLLAGLTTEQVLARCPAPQMAFIGGSEGITANTDVSDRTADYPAFLAGAGPTKTRDENTDRCHDVSNNDNDTDAPYPAFCDSFAPVDVAVGDKVAEVGKPTFEAADFLASIAAWKRFHAIPEIADDRDRESRIKRRHTMQEQTRAGTLYGNQPPRDDAEHDHDLDLEEARDFALAAFVALDPAWQQADRDDERDGRERVHHWRAA